MAHLSREPGAMQLGLFDAPPPSEVIVVWRAPEPAATPPVNPGFRHPRAQREMKLGEHLVAYELRRARRRSIGFIVGAEGLSVAAPRWVSQGDIESALREKAVWILRKLAEQQERGQRLQAARVDWRDGTAIPFLGEDVIVVLDPRATPSGAVLNAGANALPGVPHLSGRRAAPSPQSAALGGRERSALGGGHLMTLHVGLPHGATPEQIRDVVQSWLQRQARRIFEERCRHFAALLGVQMRRLSLSSAQTRWGSANADGSVRLNWRLVHFGMATIDYVVAHELAHLRHMNHSAKFWDVVRSVVPDFESARGALRSEVLPVLE